MRLGVMCSGNGSNFENIHHACPKHDIVIMVYNKKKARATRITMTAIVPHNTNLVKPSQVFL